MQTKVLAVDDEAAELNLMCHALRGQNYGVFVAASYRDAINTFRMHHEEISLLITDVALPGRNGCELARDLLQIDPGLKVLFISGPTGAKICRFYNMPVTGQDFLQKPFGMDELLNRVGKILGLSVPIRTMGAS